MTPSRSRKVLAMTFSRRGFSKLALQALVVPAALAFAPSSAFAASSHAAVLDILSQQLNVSREQLLDNARLVDDLGANELQLVELQMVIEQQFGVFISEDDMSHITTVGKLVQYIDGNK